jgi:predicted transcriptional regulator
MADSNTENVASLIELAGEITIAWLQNPNVKPEAQDVHAFLKDMHAAVTALNAGPAPEAEAVTYQPKVPARGSVKGDHIVSLIDGKKYKTLKRHLALHDLTPDQYRERYGLKHDYPMVAPDYAAQRREIAQKLGLGRKVAAKTDAAPVSEVSGKVAIKPKRAAAKSKDKGTGASVAVPTPEKEEAPAKAKASTAKAGADAAAAAPAKAKTAAKPKAPAAKKAGSNVAKVAAKKPRTAKAAAPSSAPEAPAES